MALNSVDSGLIELRINELAQLFNSFDPSPFHERDLDADAEDYIVGWARELPTHMPLQIVVHLPPLEIDKAHTRELDVALAHYFAERAEKTGRDLKELFRVGRRYLMIGVPLLVVCLTASQFVESLLGAGSFSRVIEESLIIVGWVANWKPIETFLYDWWPIKRRRDLYRRLAGAPVTIKAAA